MNEHKCQHIGCILEAERLQLTELLEPLFGMMFGEPDTLQVLFFLEGSQEGQIQILMDFYENNEIPKMKPDGLNEHFWTLLNLDGGMDTESFHMARVAAVLGGVLIHESEHFTDSGDLANAIRAYGQAGMMLGASLALGTTYARSDSVNSNARRLSASRHAEHRAMKQDVFEWLDGNMSQHRSMDKAAEAIAGKVVPIAVRTARDWVGEWKKLRSASTP